MSNNTKFALSVMVYWFAGGCFSIYIFASAIKYKAQWITPLFIFSIALLTICAFTILQDVKDELKKKSHEQSK